MICVSATLDFLYVLAPYGVVHFNNDWLIDWLIYCDCQWKAEGCWLAVTSPHESGHMTVTWQLRKAASFWLAVTSPNGMTRVWQHVTNDTYLAIMTQQHLTLPCHELPTYQTSCWTGIFGMNISASIDNKLSMLGQFLLVHSKNAIWAVCNIKSTLTPTLPICNCVFVLKVLSW